MRLEFEAAQHGLHPTRSAVLRVRSLLQHSETLQGGVYLVGTVYNFCTYHESLRVPLYVGRAGRTHWVPRTPAMAAGITHHLWSVAELLSYPVTPARWTPPKRRGRHSRTINGIGKKEFKRKRYLD